MILQEQRRLRQLKETTMIVGIDVGNKRYFGAVNWAPELTKKSLDVFKLYGGSNSFCNTIVELMQKSELERH